VIEDGVLDGVVRDPRDGDEGDLVNRFEVI
jgi:hypothetical protein